MHTFTYMQQCGHTDCHLLAVLHAALLTVGVEELIQLEAVVRPQQILQ